MPKVFPQLKPNYITTSRTLTDTGRHWIKEDMVHPSQLSVCWLLSLERIDATSLPFSIVRVLLSSQEVRTAAVKETSSRQIDS